MGADNDKVLLDRKEEIFDYWCKYQNVAQTAEHFQLDRKTIYRFMEQENWEERFGKVKRRLQRKTETEVVNVLNENLEFVRAVKKKLLLSILGKTEVEGTISELIKLMEYEDKIIGAFPADQSGVTNNFIFQVINGLNDREREQLNGNLAVYFGNGLYRHHASGGNGLSVESNVPPGDVSTS